MSEAAVAARARGGARLRGRRCPDCGADLVYYPHLSSPAAAADGRRLLAYSCPECTDDFERPRMIVVRRAAAAAARGGGGGGDNGGDIETIYIEIVERRRGAA